MTVSMIEVRRSESKDALGAWGDDIARYVDRDLLLEATRARSGEGIEGTRWGIDGRHPLERADEQRAVLARTIRAELEDASVADSCGTVLVFDQYWQPSTFISRSRGGDRLLTEWRGVAGLVKEPTDVSCAVRGAEIRWFATLSLDLAQLEQVLEPLERGTAALTLSADSPKDAAELFHDLFDDQDRQLTTQQFWPSWAARRTSRGERVLLAGEHNDHTGREAFLLGTNARAQ